MISQKLLRAILFTPADDRGRWGIPALFWGESGVAKTDVVERLGAVFGMPTETLSPGERGEGAFGVTPVPSSGCEYMTYPPPDWTRKFSEARRGIVFVDEATCAPPAIQPAILGLVQARRIGGAYLGPGVRVLGAANPPEIAAGGWDLAPPVANRFAHFQWDCPTVAEWSDWLFDNVGVAAKTESAAAEEERVLFAWASPWAVARGYVTGFLRRRPEFMHKRPPVGDPVASRAWPSPRTWSYAARALAAGVVHGLNDVDAEAYLRACVGDGATNEFVAWRREADLPDPHDVLDRKVAFKHDPSRLDRSMAILSSCAAIVAPVKSDRRSERASVLWEILDNVSLDAKDIAVISAKQLVAAKLHEVCREGPVVVGRLWPVLQKTAKL